MITVYCSESSSDRMTIDKDGDGDMMFRFFRQGELRGSVYVRESDMRKLLSRLSGEHDPNERITGSL